MSGASRLRYSCGYKLANDGIDTRAIQDWLGHVSITDTTRYTALSQTRFKELLAGLILSAFWFPPPSISR